MQSQNLIIVGAGWAGRTIASVLLQNKEVRKISSNVIGFVDDQPQTDRIIVSNGNGGHLLPVLGHSSQLLDIVR